MQDLNDKTTGSTLTAAEWNEVPSEIQNVIEGLGLTLSSGDLNQLGKAIAGYVANGIFYTDSGIADAYVLTKIGLKQTATAYADGFFASFIAGNPGTGGAATVNVAGLGVKNIKLSGGGDPLAGSISGRVSLVFDGPNDRFELLGVEIDRLNPATLAIAIGDATLQVGDVLNVKKDRAGNAGGGTWEVVLKSGVTVSTGAPDVGNVVASTGVGTLALVLQVVKKQEVTEYGKTSTKLGESINKAISDLHKSGGEETGGVVRLPKVIGNLEESIVIDNTVQSFSVDGITLEGYGRQTSRFDATALSAGQNGVNCVFPIYTNLHDFAILNSPNHGVFFDDIVSSAGNRNQIKRVQSKFAGVNGFEFARTFLTTLEGTESEFNGNNGYHWDTEVHTSWDICNNYAKDNTAAGFHFGRMVYSHVHANASDFNQNGYLITNSRGLTFTANGAEFNDRAGWLFITDATNNIRNHCSGTGNLANDNNLTDSGFANHTHLTAAGDIPNFVYQKQAISLVSTTANTKDFIASGRGAVLTLEDPLMLNDGPQALNDGFVQVNLTAPKLIYQKTFTATQTQKITGVKNQNGLTADYSGEILITCSNSAFGTSGSIGTSTYKLLISKSLAGLEIVEIAKLGLVNGAAASHPSFLFTLAADEIDATAQSATAGDFWFAVEKIGGNVLFV